MVRDALAQITKGASIIIIGTVFASIIGLLNQIAMGRILGPNDYGLFSLGVSIMTILCVLPQFGLGQGLTQYVPYNIQKNKLNEIKDAINFSLKFTLIIGIIVSIFLFIFSDYIAIKFFNNPELGLVIKGFSIALTFWALHNTIGSLTQAFKTPKYYVYIENISIPIIQLSIFISLSLIGYKLFGAITGFIISSIFAAISYIYIMRSKYHKSLEHPNNKNSNINSNEAIRDLIKLSYPLFLAGFTLLFMQYPDKIILGVFTNSSEVGLYTAALTISTITLLIYTAFSFNSRPILAEYYAKNNFSSMEKLYSFTTKWIFFITFPLVIYLIFYSKDIIEIVYGSSFLNASVPLAILSLGIAINGLTGLSGEALISIRKTKLNFYCEVIGASSNIILNITLIPFFGIIGAAIGTSLSITFRNISSFCFMYKNLKINPYNINFLKIILGSIIPFIIIYPFKNNFEPYGFLKVLPIFIVCYIGFLIITKSFDDLDKFMIEIILKKIFIYIMRILSIFTNKKY
jgi:O-antigen/teichoic acid export membrane protein